MENASKALMMVAGVLIGLMIISLAVYLFTTFGSASAEVHENVRMNKVNEFNSQFTKYAGKEDITIYDVITVANAATENNINYDFPTKQSTPPDKNEYYIAVTLEGKGRIEYGTGTATSDISSRYQGYITDDINKINTTNKELPKYKCSVTTSDVTSRVLEIKFTKR